MKRVMALGVMLVLLTGLLSGCGKPKLSDEIAVDGVHYTVHKLDESPMFAPAGMAEGYVAFDLALAYTVDEGADFESSRSKLDRDVRFETPDGEQYEMGVSYTAEEGDIHGFFVGVPEGTDISQLVMVYDKQRMALV